MICAGLLGPAPILSGRRAERGEQILGKLIETHVIARPHDEPVALLPK